MIQSSFDFLNKELLLNKYKNLGFWSRVAKDIGISEGNLIKIRKKLGIFNITQSWRFPRTLNQNTTKESLNFRKNITANKLLKTYKEFGSWRKVAEYFKVSHNLIIQIRKHLGIYIKTKTIGEKYSGVNSKLYKAKYKDKYGYIIISRHNPKNYKNRPCKEHTLVMEKHLGRNLKPNEQIHHIDGNKANNNINNLILCDTAGHRHIERQLQEIGYKLIRNGIIVFDHLSGRYSLRDRKDNV